MTSSVGASTSIGVNVIEGCPDQRMVEHVNGPISDVLTTRRYGSGENLRWQRVYLLEHTDER